MFFVNDAKKTRGGGTSDVEFSKLDVGALIAAAQCCRDFIESIPFY